MTKLGDMVEEEIVLKPNCISTAALWLRDSQFTLGKTAGMAIAIAHMRSVAGSLFAAGCCDGSDDEDAITLRTVAEQLEGDRMDIIDWDGTEAQDKSKAAFDYLIDYLTQSKELV